MVMPSIYTQEEMDQFIVHGYWDRANSLDFWEQNADKYPDDEAVVDSKSRLTWSEVKRLSDRWSRETRWQQNRKQIDS